MDFVDVRMGISIWGRMILVIGVRIHCRFVSAVMGRMCVRDVKRAPIGLLRMGNVSVRKGISLMPTMYASPAR